MAHQAAISDKAAYRLAARDFASRSSDAQLSREEDKLSGLFFGNAGFFDQASNDDFRVV